jgi:hypothetical protein
MGFVPGNELEQAMLLAASNETARPDFYRLLLASELVALGEMGERLSIETVENNGKLYHPLFTSDARVRDFSRTPMAQFRINGLALFKSTRGASFVINPGSELVKTLSPEEITWCLASLSAPSGSIVVAQPKVFPKRLVKALCVLFTSRTLIKSAHLVYVAREGVDREAHPMIGLVADEDVPRLAKEIFAVAAEVLPGTVVDVVWLNPEGPKDPLQNHLMNVPPFYKRTATLN